MEPRLKSSRNWTPFPKDFVELISKALQDEFAERLPLAHFIVEGRIYPQEILLRMGYRLPDRLKQDNFEASVLYESQAENFTELIHLGVDCLASLLNEHIAKYEKPAEFVASDSSPGQAEIPWPHVWKELVFENQSFHVRYTTVNSQLEAAADALLNPSAGKRLVHETPPSEEALDYAGSNDGGDLRDSDALESDLDLDIDPNLDMKRPTLFSRPSKKH